MRSVLISTNLSSLICSWLASWCNQRSSSQQRFPWALQLKEQITDGHVFFQDVILSVSFWLRSFPVCGWWTRLLSSVSGLPTRWRCVRGWLMRLLWAYEHDFAAISPFLSERIGTLFLIYVGKGTAAWLSPAAMYSVVPAGTNVSEFALGGWEGCNLLHGICL